MAGKFFVLFFGVLFLQAHVILAVPPSTAKIGKSLKTSILLTICYDFYSSNSFFRQRTSRREYHFQYIFIVVQEILTLNVIQTIHFVSTIIPKTNSFIIVFLVPLGSVQKSVLLLSARRRVVCTFLFILREKSAQSRHVRGDKCSPFKPSSADLTCSKYCSKQL